VVRNRHRFFPRGLIVSCQALEDEPLHGSDHMVVMVKAAIMGGAVAIRANSPEDIRSIRRETDVPIIGLYKRVTPGFDIYITPTFESARAVAEAGADVVAIDATLRPRPDGLTLDETIRRIHEELGVGVMADISTLEEGINAARAGVDIISTTLAGYTPWSRSIEGPDYQLLEELIEKVDVPVILEGRVWAPEEAGKGIKKGAFGVVVGTAITRPQIITRRFAKAVEEALSHGNPGYTVGIDIGGTSIKAGLVDEEGQIHSRVKVPTNATGGINAIITGLKGCLQGLLRENPEIQAIGVASAGQIHPATGIVTSATPNLPGWQGTNIPRVIEEIVGRKIKVVADNDANAAAYGEYLCGAGRGFNDLVCLTIGTGVGGGIISGGKLIRGAFGAGGELGHMSIDPNGLLCNCGNIGCVEAYISGWAIAKRFETSPEELFDDADRGDAKALEAMADIGEYLGYALVNVVNMLQPQRVVLGGSIGSRSKLYLRYALQIVNSRALECNRGRLDVVEATLGNNAGIVGASMLARDL
jgi:putative N-acetylmannosamine-6-phosphate epimerase/predicted NBD/HSP70 family sugar kinase